MTSQERDPEADGPAGAADDEDLEPEDELEEDEDLEAEETEEGEEELEAQPQRGREERPVAGVAPGPRRRGRQPVRPTVAPPSVSEQAVRVHDRASGVFVIGVIAVFVAILLYGMLLGHGGFISNLMPTPTPPPTPVPTVSAAPSASAGASESPAPSASESAAPSASPGASESPAASGSAVPSAAASPSPSPS